VKAATQATAQGTAQGTARVICEWCCEPFEQLITGRRQLTCSPQCRRDRRRDRRRAERERDRKAGLCTQCGRENTSRLSQCAECRESRQRQCRLWLTLSPEDEARFDTITARLRTRGELIGKPEVIRRALKQLERALAPGEKE
jgi:hypothetical protein